MRSYYAVVTKCPQCGREQEIEMFGEQMSKVRVVRHQDRQKKVTCDGSLREVRDRDCTVVRL